MSDQTDNLTNLIKPYGLSDEESNLYLFLLQNGSKTALTASRELHLGRTKIYRLLDKLKEKQLVEFQIQERGMKFAATHPHKFQHLLTTKEHEITTLKQNLPDVITQLTNMIPKTDKNSKVLYYQGVQGLKQVSYNITKAKDKLRVFEMEHLDSFTDIEFSERVRTKLLQNQITTQDLTNTPKFPGFSDITEFITKYSHFRYINPKKLKIQFEVLIYNNVYATYTYHNKEVFCVEIYNKHLANMQKQIFDFIWSQAQPMYFTDKRGGASI